MTKEEFLQLQELQRNSGLPLMKYLDKVGLKYSTYTYWNVTIRYTKNHLQTHRTSDTLCIRTLYCRSSMVSIFFLSYKLFESVYCLFVTNVLHLQYENNDKKYSI